MTIIETTNQLRDAAKQHGKFREISRISGVSFPWLCKFAVGEITNPTINSVAKLERFFNKEIQPKPIIPIYQRGILQGYPVEKLIKQMGLK
jgi:hypothetical protein